MPSRAFELQHLLSKGRDLHGRDSDTIRRQRARVLEWIEPLRSICAGIEQGELEFGDISSATAQLHRLVVSADVFSDCAARDGEFLAVLGQPPEGARAEGGEATGVRAPPGTPSRDESESRCVSGPQFSSPRAFAAPPSPARIETARESCSARRAQLVAEVLRELGSQEHESTVQLVRAQADALSEAELAGFLARAAWRTAPESWAETDAWKRAEWLLRNLVRWRESAEEGS